MGILELLLGGGATGLLGTVVSQVLGIFTRAEDRKEKALDYQHELRLQEMQLASLKEETERELLIAESSAQSSGYIAALQHDSSFGGTSQWVNDTRSIFRPLITLVLVLLTALIYFTTSQVHIETTITDAVIFSTIAAISFWFSDRSISKSVSNYRKMPWQ